MRRRSLADRNWWPAAVAVVTAVYALVPALLEPQFYLRGDSGAQFAPTWFHLGELVRGGQWPVWLDPGAWVGGNYAAEALYGIYSPVSVPIWLLVSVSPSLLLAMLVVKVVAMVVLALGTYAVSRDHDAAPWASAAVAVALPISGYTLFWDAGSWVSGLLAFATTPWVWWAFRRAAAGRLNPGWAFLIGSLGVLQGNPYGTLAVVVTGFAVAVEIAVSRDWRALRLLVLTGLCVAAWLPLVYLPLLDTAGLAVRSQGELFSNNGKLRPAPGDFLALSSPSYVPQMRAITGPMQVPATYFAWFLLPLLPWLRWDVVRCRWRELVAVGVVGVVYLLLAVGPSKLWLFRWPMRMVEYFFLALAVLLAVVLGRGLKRDHWVQRTAATAALVLGASWLTWAQDPAWRRVAFSGPLLLIVLSAALVLLLRSRAGTSLVAALLIGGSGVVVLSQVAVFGENASSRPWHFPTDVSALQHRFADRDGRVLQLADLASLQAPRKDAELRAAWRHYLAGSMYQVADVDAVNSYSGMGFLPFTRTLCMQYDGLAKSCGYANLWKPDSTTGVPLADLMKLDTVVVQPKLTSGVEPPDGWEVTSTKPVVVVERTTGDPWPDSELSWAAPGADVTAARTDGPYRQTVELSDTGTGGALVFALLDWPGYTATLDGEEVPVGRTDAGLLTVQLPADAQGTLEVGYRPPGLTLGLAAAGLGVLGAVALSVVARRRRVGAAESGNRSTR